jgi:hypothetical protein
MCSVSKVGQAASTGAEQQMAEQARGTYAGAPNAPPSGKNS